MAGTLGQEEDGDSGVTAHRLRLTPAHRFPPHAHSTWSFGIVWTGSVQLRTATTSFDVGNGLATVLPPGEVHEGIADRQSGLSYAAISVAPRLIAEVIGREDTPDLRTLGPAASVGGLLSAATSAGAEDRRELMVNAIADVFSGSGSRADPIRLSTLTRAARRILDEEFLQPVNVKTVAERLGVAPATLIRRFRRELGIPPYSYVVSRRVDFARQLLDSGIDSVQAAQRAGFYDQAHLTRYFARLVGVSPGRYVRS
ncbi:AraC family transcriptional regulator [Kribbella swartbergensis]